MPQKSTTAVTGARVVLERVVDADSGDVFSIVQADQTGHLTTHPVPNDLNRYYSASYHGDRHGFTARYCDWRRLRIVRSWLASASPKWLDVGCGDGTLIDSARRQRWSVYGVERFPELARKRGLTVFGSLDEAGAEGPFDCVTLWHVLEHLTEPQQDLETIHSLLKPGGVLIIAVPDAGSWVARWFGRHWLHWDVPRHLHHFSARSLGGLLATAGFEAQQLRRSEYEYDLLGFAQSTLNWLGFAPNTFFKLLTKRRVQQPTWLKLTNFVLGGWLCAVAAIPVGLCGLRGHGGTLIFFARRRDL
ncbi:MAG: class I SAM-dependent methyltransferase [Pirellulaceae bacterium]|nr:class I SAM-dependent methyltransferase [Pirellulaceae bacterium]